MAVIVSTHLFWVLSRGAGTTALILSSVSVSFGLVMGGKLIKGGAPDRRAYHEILSLSVMVSIAVHSLALVGDSFLHPSLLDVTMPFVFSYKTLATSLGPVLVLSAARVSGYRPVTTPVTRRTRCESY